MPKKFINRELSWLEFNQRILEQARDERVPLLERAKFMGIVSTNLDEFFMVRVGGLQALELRDSRKTDPAGMTSGEQLALIAERAHRMVADQYTCYRDSLEPELSAAGITRVTAAELNPAQRAHVEHVFEQEFMPVLTPIGVFASSELPLLANRSLHLGVRLRHDPKRSDRPRYAVVPLGRAVGRIIALPSAGGYQFILAEDLARLFMPRLFPGMGILECVPFRITRNADLDVREDLAGDLLAEMEEVLDARRKSDCVRLEIARGASSALLTFLQKALRLSKSVVYQVDGPIDLSAFQSLPQPAGHDELRFDPWLPQPSPQIEPGRKMIEILSQRDVLLYHPFESFEPVLRMIDEAADDPDVVAIKQILYRTSRSSPIVGALMRAAEKGKHVTALVELKARFDEARNIEWAQELQDAGVQVVYGVRGLKTHAKLLMIVRREPAGLRRYLHLGTGNYNEITAQLYCDVSYMTGDEDLGADATVFFNAITGYSQPQRFHKLVMAPLTLREKITELIAGEIERSRQGQKAFIRAKLNSLADPGMVKALYRASEAGVQVQLNVRGICCLRPGVDGLSETISVTSIVDRFLEHARILHCRNGGKDLVFISTADWMPRNLDRRIELLVPVDDPECRKRLLVILDTSLKDSVNAWRLLPSGRYERMSSLRKKGLRSQEALYRQACDAAKATRKLRPTVFEPHRPRKP